MHRDRRAFIRSINSSCKRALRVVCKLEAVPTPVRVVVVGIAFLAVCFVVNLVYQILHKPTEMFALIPGESNKDPIETWRQYAPLFREYSTTSISPELLAALAQVESAGNPIARTYWRWSLTSDPFAVYHPASSAVGMYQMTDAALSEAQGYCILHHTVVETGCSATLLHSRVVPRGWRGRGRLLQLCDARWRAGSAGERPAIARHCEWQARQDSRRACALPLSRGGNLMGSD